MAGFKVAQELAIEVNDVKAAQKILDLSFDDARSIISLNRGLSGTKELHKYPVDNAVPPALWFNPPKGGKAIPAKQEEIEWGLPENIQLPENKNDLAFYTVAELSVLIRKKQISSVELTEFFIERLEIYGDTLQSVITITKDRALNSAKRADNLLAKGTYLGPLHGIPYGAKDLLSVPDYKTT